MNLGVYIYLFRDILESSLCCLFVSSKHNAPGLMGGEFANKIFNRDGKDMV